MRYLICILIAASLYGCATDKGWHWEKDGASARDFNLDRSQCNAQAFAGGNGNMWTIAIIQNQCLKGKGWYQVDNL